MTSSKDNRHLSGNTQANKDQQQSSGHKGHGKDKDNGKDKDMHKDSKRPQVPDEDDDEVVNDAGAETDPERKTQIDDNPDETRKKIPHMRK